MKGVMEGQMSLFDLDTWSGRMSPEHSVPTVEKTSELSSKKLQGSKIQAPLFLDLRGSGRIPAASWETGGLLLGVYTMHSFGESPSEERESHLSQILTDNPHPKYFLSARAAQGILNRAKKRGKALPKELEDALAFQAQQ